jgi:hypothetical protein
LILERLRDTYDNDEQIARDLNCKVWSVTKVRNKNKIGNPSKRMRRDIKARLTADPTRSRRGISEELKVCIETVQCVVSDLGLAGKGVLSHKGPANGMFGKKMSATTRAKMSESAPKKRPWLAGANSHFFGKPIPHLVGLRKGKKCSAEHRARVSAAQRQRWERRILATVAWG